MITWLHLSDAHLCKQKTGWDSRRILHALRTDLQKVQKDFALSPDLIFFTGDLVFGDLPGTPISTQFRDAYEFLESVRRLFAKEIPADKLFLVPGNHDVNRNRILDFHADYLDRLGTDVVNRWLRDTPSEWTSVIARLEDYKNFLEESGYNHLLTDARRLICTQILKVNDIRLGIAALNSAWSSGRDSEQGRLRFGRWQVETALEALEASDLKLVVTHHPADWFSEFEKTEISLGFERDFDFHLHGHEHFNWVQQVNEHIRIGAGACYDRSDRENGYNLVRLDIENGKGEVFLRRYDKDGRGWIPRIVANQTDNYGRWHLNLRPVEILGGKERSGAKATENRIGVSSAISARRRAASPYAVGSIITDPKDLYGRDRELSALATWVFRSSSNNTQVLGERKFGKTSLLRSFVQLSRQEGVDALLVYCDVSQFLCRSWVDFYLTLLKETHDQLLDEPDNKASRVLETLKLLYIGTPPLRFENQFVDDLIRSRVDEFTGIDIFRRYFAALKRNNIYTVLFLDELAYALHHFVDNDLHFTHLRGLAMEKDLYWVTIVCSDRRSWEEIAPERAGSPGLNFITQTIRLGPIEETEARRLISENAKNGNPTVEFSEDELVYLMWASGRMPYLVQLMAEKFYFRKAVGEVVDTSQIWDETFAAAHSHLLEQWRVTTLTERTALRAISGGLNSADQITQEARSALLTRNLLVTRPNGGVAPYSPLFGKVIEEQVEPTLSPQATRILTTTFLKHHEAQVLRVMERWGAIKTMEDIEDWLLNFADERERSFALNLLIHIRHYDLNRMRRWCKSLHNRLNVLLGAGIDRTQFMVAGGPTKSGEVIARYYSSANNLHPSRFAYRQDLGEPRRNYNYVLLDDFIGSGHQIIRFWFELMPNWRKARWICSTLLAYDNGLQQIQAETKFETLVAETLTSRDKVFSPDAGIYSGADAEAAKAVFKKYGNVLWPEHPLGFEDGQALVVFHDSVPNNTLPVIWSNKKGWKPIFARHGG